jgi:hypothetical protein
MSFILYILFGQYINYIKINRHSQLKVLLSVFSIHHNMFRTVSPSLRNIKNTGRLTTTLWYKKEEMRNHFYVNGNNFNDSCF